MHTLLQFAAYVAYAVDDALDAITPKKPQFVARLFHLNSSSAWRLVSICTLVILSVTIVFDTEWDVFYLSLALLGISFVLYVVSNVVDRTLETPQIES